MRILTLDNTVFDLDHLPEEYDEIATSTGKIIVATYGVAAVGINIPSHRKN